MSGTGSTATKAGANSALSNGQCAAVHLRTKSNEFRFRLSSDRSCSRNDVRGSSTQRDGLTTFLKKLDRRAGVHYSYDNLFGYGHHPDNSKSAGLTKRSAKQNPGMFCPGVFIRVRKDAYALAAFRFLRQPSNAPRRRDAGWSGGSFEAGVPPKPSLARAREMSSQIFCNFLKVARGG
jgi:hypothetical protein